MAQNMAWGQRWLGWCGAAVVAAAIGGCGGGGDGYEPRVAVSSVANPTLTGPIAVTVPLGDASHDYPQLATQADLAGNGYVEEEFFFEGTANRYDTPALATGAVAVSGLPYKSRMLVRRPRDGGKFNGTVVVEWLNVTSGYNLDALWQSSANYFMRSGYAYVGVSAQRVGVHQAVTGLKAWGPARYASLDVTAGGTVTDDALSYDVFAQAAKAIGAPKGIDPLGGLAKRRTVLAAGVSVIFFAGLSWKLVLPPVVIGGVGIAVLVLLGDTLCADGVRWPLLHDYQQQRVCTLLDPTRDPLGKGFHIIQGMIAIGSGGLWGKGFMAGTQTHLEFIPERTTDFIFAAFSEEFGLMGNLFLIVCFVLLVWRGLAIAAGATSMFGRLMAGAVSMIFFTYAFVNMGMVSGILPVVGVPLPFISYGGTAMVTLGLALGILMSVARAQKQEVKDPRAAL